MSIKDRTIIDLMTLNQEERNFIISILENTIDVERLLLTEREKKFLSPEELNIYEADVRSLKKQGLI